MNSFDRAQRDYENPPDEPEARYCETCGHEMVEKNLSAVGKVYWICENYYCPDEFTIVDHYYEDGLVRNMAIHLAEVEEALRSTRNVLKYVRRKLSLTEDSVVERDRIIEELEQKISDLTRSQQGE